MTLRRLLLFIFVLLLLLAAWLWWNRPQKVDLAAYVPADTLIYLESNSLPEIVEGIISTDAWKVLAPSAGIKSNLGEVSWLSHLAALTGIGSDELVVLSRTQIAVTVTGFDAVETSDTLKVRPRAALIAVTHASESRTRAVVEKRIGDFARRAYGEPRVERKEIDGVVFTNWNVPEGERGIVTAVDEDIAVIGNEESIVRACLAVHRGDRPNLAGNAQLQEMRAHMDSKKSLVFGYVSPAGAQMLLEVAATAYAAQISADARAQSAAASVLPQLASRIFGGAGWSARISGGVVEDRYFILLQNGVATRLRDAFLSVSNATSKAGELLPRETYSMTRYNYLEPEAAWRSLNAAISSQLDALGAIFITRLLEAALEPYGIDEPETFLRAIGSETITARLNEAGESTVVVVEVGNDKALREFAIRRLGRGTKKERIGDAELLISQDEELGAASFIAGYLIMGLTDNVRRCLLMRLHARTLAANESFQRAMNLISNDSPANVVTFTNDAVPALSFMNIIASQQQARERPVNKAEMERALRGLAYAVSETRLVEKGFEKTTRSSFGQFGTIADQFAPTVDTEAKH